MNALLVGVVKEKNGEWMNSSIRPKTAPSALMPTQTS